MIKSEKKYLLIDGREFVPSRLTGIGRVIMGFTDALQDRGPVYDTVLAVHDEGYVPPGLKNRSGIRFVKVGASFLKSERRLSLLTREADLFISPYPKLPVFGCSCRAVNMVHDVLDLTYPAYKRRIKTVFDRYRLKQGLIRADLTWFVSEWSRQETEKLVGTCGSNPRVRYNGIDARFQPGMEEFMDDIIAGYGLSPGYILVIGNGKPHKNLGVLLEISTSLSRKLVFTGVPDVNRRYWQKRYPDEEAVWIRHIQDKDLASVIKGSFCVAQPSTAEGYGYPPLEAMACGVPVIVSNIPVLIETTSGNSLVADTFNPASWIDSFNRLEQEQLYKEYTVKGLEWIAPMIGSKGWKKHVADIRELLMEGT